MARQFQMQQNGAFVLPSSCVDNEAMSASSPAGVTKTRHLHIRGTNFGLAVGATPVTAEHIVHRCAIAGTLRNFRALLEETGSSVSIAFDLKKYNAANPGGITVLSGVVTLTHSDTDRVASAGTINLPTTEAGDVLTIAMTVSSSTGATGAWAEVEVDEAAV